MSLLSDAMTPCVFIDKQRVDDGEGGIITQYTESAEFLAAVTFDSSMQARIAGQSGVTSLYTVTVLKGTVIEYHDVFKRLSDSKIFRVTSDGDDRQTPKSATMQVLQVTAEEWSLTS